MLQHRNIQGSGAAGIAASVERGIRSGALAPGQTLPPVRALAMELGVSPTTVAAAYKDLRVRGLAAAEGRRGTRIAARPPLAARPPMAAPAGVHNLATGNPDTNLLPDLGRVLRTLNPGHRLYGEATNRPELLQAARRGFERDGVPAGSLAVTGGALDAIERVLQANLRPGDRVLVEDPGYYALADLLAALGLRAVPVAVDDDGILPELLEAALRTPAQALVLTPRAQNPFGSALSEGRAAELRGLIGARTDLLLIEDDHAGPVAGAPARTLADSTRERWAVVRSVAKSLGPDLRLAMLAGDPTTISRVEGRLQVGPGWVSHLLQLAVVALWSDRETSRLLERAAAVYREGRDRLLAELASRGIAAHGRSGLNVWVPVADEGAAVARLLGAGFAVTPGERYRRHTGPAVRITAATLTADEAVRVAIALAASGGPARTRSA